MSGERPLEWSNLGSPAYYAALDERVVAILYWDWQQPGEEGSIGQTRDAWSSS